MKIEVHVKPNARKQGIEKVSEGIYKVSVNAAPQEGRANAAAVELLAEYFGVSKRSIVIVRGEASRKKIVEVSKNLQARPQKWTKE